MQLTTLVREFLAARGSASEHSFCEWSEGGNLETAVALVVPWVASWRKRGEARPVQFLLSTAPAGVSAAIQLAAKFSDNASDDFADCRHAYLHEELLATGDGASRRRRGVYYTPPEVARYIVSQVDRVLEQELNNVDGLADPRLRILDPAAGSGVFLAEAVRNIHRRLQDRWTEDEFPSRWNEFVSRQLLPRLVGWEMMPEAVVASHCVFVNALAETGYMFRDSPSLRLVLRDALAPAIDEPPFQVILGNPPYASLSTAAHGWIESLISDEYTRVDGAPLGERKHWLHDEYVKFLRLAQWHIEQCGWGVAGLVTNHGYLENATFRGLRASLLHAFPRIHVIDLHGNAKLQERSPNGSREENVFGIAAGIAIGIFARSPVPGVSTVRHAELWGTRAEKLARLAADDVASVAIAPLGPHYRFTPRRAQSSPRYESAWRLCDAMPLNTTAPVTARDRFVVAFTREELLDRMAAFCDLSIPDGEIRQRYFTRTRSSRYAPGDSRGWKLAEARRTLAADATWRDKIILCQYRPLDYRYVIWHDALIDWPRTDVLRHLLAHDNLALIARRQSPRGAAANFVWATRTLALDGVIRSDNRGSESLFPVWRFDDHGTPEANFAPEFLNEMQRATGLPVVADTLSLAGYIYGLLWSPAYRSEHPSQLCDDFPRIVLPRDAEEYSRLSECGLALLDLHTMLPATSKSSAARGPRIASGDPRWEIGRVLVDGVNAIAMLSQTAWELRVGAHQPARKWLKDRRGRALTSSDVAWYRWLVEVLEKTVLVAR